MLNRSRWAWIGVIAPVISNKNWEPPKTSIASKPSGIKHPKPKIGVGCVGERFRGNGLAGLSPTHRRSPCGITSRFVCGIGLSREFNFQCSQAETPKRSESRHGVVATPARKSISGPTGENPLKWVLDVRSGCQKPQENPLEWALCGEPGSLFHGGWRLTRTDTPF